MKSLTQYKFSEWTMVITATVIYTVFAWLVLQQETRGIVVLLFSLAHPPLGRPSDVRRSPRSYVAG